MTKTGVFLLILLSFASALSLQTRHSQTLNSGLASLKGDNGLYLQRCPGCAKTNGLSYDTAAVTATQPDSLALWNIENYGKSIALKADNGLYLETCIGCLDGMDVAFVTGTFYQESTRWRLEALSDGKWGLRGFNGKYLARCSDCAADSSKSYVFVYADSSSSSNAQWVVNYQFPTGKKIALYADLWPYTLAVCHQCSPAKYPWQATMHINDLNSQWTVWVAQRAGDKIAFKGHNEKYLNRCTNCYNQSQEPDAAFVMGDSPSGASLWTPIPMYGGWAFQGDNGKYLARCHYCINGPQYNHVFVYAKDPREEYLPSAVWYIDYRK